MIWKFSFYHDRHVVTLRCLERKHYKIYMLFLIIPLYIDNWKTEYVDGNGKTIEK